MKVQDAVCQEREFSEILQLLKEIEPASIGKITSVLARDGSLGDHGAVQLCGPAKHNF